MPKPPDHEDSITFHRKKRFRAAANKDALRIVEKMKRTGIDGAYLFRDDIEDAILGQMLQAFYEGYSE